MKRFKGLMANYQKLRTSDDYRKSDPELKLWRAVLGLAADDAVKNRYKFQEGRNAVDQARSWFLHPTSNFITVCHYAGYDPGYIQYKMKKAIKKQEEKEHD
tara:strand:- start:1276 stop:1578 length:303 start_codon:yes stop_codon:yes gene_type:complete